MSVPVYLCNHPLLSIKVSVLSYFEFPKNELRLHLIMYSALLFAQILIHSEKALFMPFLVYQVFTWISLLLACSALRINENRLLIPLLIAIIFDMFRFLVCAVSMTAGTRSYFFENCKICKKLSLFLFRVSGFLSYHQYPESYSWAAIYTAVFLYLYWTAATLNKIIGGASYKPVPVPARAPMELPLVIPQTPSPVVDLDSPPRYKVLSQQETPPPHYSVIKQTFL